MDKKSLEEINSNLERGTTDWYEALYDLMDFDPGFEGQITHATQRVLGGRDRYESVEEITSVPWYMIGAIHNMESGCDFRAVLHNGEKIIGTNRQTVLVPKGRGPFSNWEEAARDAIKIESLFNADNWTLGQILRRLETYNGMGYLRHHKAEYTPYLWACSTINDGTGKYVADGKWSETAITNSQVGSAVILKQLERWQEILIPRGSLHETRI